MKSLKEGCKYSTATNVYRKHVTEVPPETHLPDWQVRNIRSMVQRQQRLSHDGLYNLHEFLGEPLG